MDHKDVTHVTGRVRMGDMSRPSVVSVYGTSATDHRPVRLGGGTLEADRVVTLDPDVAQRLASDHPPEVLRVGIAGIREREPVVEVLEVRQVLHSEVTGQWAVELWGRAESPTVWETRSEDADQPVGPMNGV